MFIEKAFYRGLASSFLAAAALVAAPASQANLVFHTTIDTSPLVGSSSAPFTLDCQYIDGGQLNNNTAIVNHFTFGAGGAATGSPTLAGGATGTLTGGVTIQDSSFVNSFDQTFTAGSLLSFDVNLTTAIDSGAGVSPDEFSFAILDKNGVELGTTDPSGANTILAVNLDRANPLIATFGSSPPTYGNVTTVTPEPASLSLIALAAGTLLARRRRGNR